MSTRIRDSFRERPGMSVDDLINDETLPADIRQLLIDEVKKTAPRYGGGRDESKTEQFLIGAGRGFYDLAQGAKQTALMAGEALGLAEQGAAQRYTDEVNNELAQYNRDFPGIGAESFGRLTGWIAPTAALAPVSLGGAAALGAAEGALGFTNSPSVLNKGINAGVGGLLGAGGTAVRNALRGPIPEAGSKGREALEYAAENNLPVRPLNLQQDSFQRGGQNVADAAIVGRAAENQLEASADHVRRLRDEAAAAAQAQAMPPQSFGARMTANQQPAPFAQAGDVSLRSGAEEGINGLRAAERQRYDRALSRVGDAPVNRTVVFEDIERVISELPPPYRGPLMKQLEVAKDSLPPNATVKDLMGFRSWFGTTQATKLADEGVEPSAVAAIYKNLSDRMMQSAGGVDEVGEGLLREAIDTTRWRHEAMNILGLKTPNEERLLQNVLSGGREEQIGALKYLMGSRGEDRVMNFILSDVFEAGYEGGQKIIGPGSMGSKLRKYEEAIQQFAPDRAAELRGLRRYLQTQSDAGSLIANPNTGGRNLATLGSAVGTATLGAGAIASESPALMSMVGIGAASQQAILPYLFRNRKARDVMAVMAKYDDASKIPIPVLKTFGDLWDDAARAAAKAANSGAEATTETPRRQPMQIEIRNGVPPVPGG